MVSILFIFIRGDSQQLLFDIDDGFSRGQTRSVAEPENVCIDGDGRLPKGRVEHDVRRLSPHAGQGFETGPVIRYLAAMPFQQEAAGSDNVFGLGSVKTNCLDVLAQSFDAEFGHFVWRRRHREQASRGFIDTHVSRLCRKNDRNQKLKGCGVAQFSCGRWICSTQTGEELLYIGFFHG